MSERVRAIMKVCVNSTLTFSILFVFVHLALTTEDKKINGVLGHDSVV